ncbi:hypothetical protein FGRMN_1858 [Fusarium graminum]|nr:hypothetical protein FGRMN_1858 [Fusarium graminum]
MPIGDLLAQISGGDEGSAPSPTPTTNLLRSNTLPKRKADDHPQPSVSKAPRVTTLSSTVGPRTTQSPTTSSRSGLPSRPSDRPTPSQRPSNQTNGGSKPTVLSSRPMNGNNRVSKPAAPSRPSPVPSNAPPVPRGAPPKKGSFAEILARAQKAQASMGQVGKIQHKKVEGGTIKKGREEPPPTKVDPRASKNSKHRPSPAASGYSGTAKPGQKNGTPMAGAGKDPRNGRPLPPSKADRGRVTSGKAPGGRAAPVEEPKKVKKAAAATTGYTGTARPRPGSEAPKKKDASRGGALLSAPRAPRPTHSKSRYEDDYDEELDDFIDYDDEEDDGGGPRYDYASDGSSDMEAGLDDIDVEERRAEQIARREDIEQERLEREHKASKEARKRQALESLRGRQRR